MGSLWKHLLGSIHVFWLTELPGLGSIYVIHLEIFSVCGPFRHPEYCSDSVVCKQSEFDVFIATPTEGYG